MHPAEGGAHYYGRAVAHFLFILHKLLSDLGPVIMVTNLFMHLSYDRKGTHLVYSLLQTKVLLVKEWPKLKKYLVLLPFPLLM